MRTRTNVVIVLAFVFAGCASENWNGTENSTSLRVDKLSSSSWIPGSKDGAGAKIEIEYERPVDDALASFVDKYVTESYMDACGEKVSSPGMNAVQEAFARRYEESGKEDDWQLKCSGAFVWFDSLFATYRTTIFTYFGGIHPDVWYGNATYDRRTGRRITLADMFDETNIVSVVNVIRRRIAADESCSGYLREKCSNDVTGVAADYLGKCDFGNPKVTENFMIVERGIVWTYNEYEISSYSEGATDVFVPWDDIGAYLREWAPTPITIPAGGWDAALEAAKKNGDLMSVGDLIYFRK